MAIYTTNQRQFAGKTIKINDIYPFYRYGGLGEGDSFKGKTYIRCTKLEDEVVDGRDERLEHVAPDSKDFDWREKIWDTTEKKWKLVKSNITDYKEFNKTYKKVYDLACEIEEPMYIKKNSQPGCAETEGDEFTLTRVGASKVRDLIGALTEFEVPLVERMNRDKVMDMLPAYDYEDQALQLLIGTSVKFSVVGAKLDTKYTYKAKPFAKKAMDDGGIDTEDIPF